MFGLPGGTLAEGAPADVTVIDPEAAWTCDARTLPVALAQHAVRRAGLARARRADHRRR